MIDLDFGPAALGGIIVLVYLAPFIYSLFVDKYDKQSPQIKSKSH
jgi:hypothetical protein